MKNARARSTLCHARSAVRPALDRIHASAIKEIIITDSIPPRADIKASPKVRVLSVARLLGEAVKRIHLGDSLSTLFI